MNPRALREMRGGPAPPKKEGHFWQELFSAGSMIVPSLYLVFMVDLTRLPILMMTVATCVHCLASASYHCQCAYYTTDPNWDHLKSPLRTADMCFIHVCMFAYCCAVSPGLWFPVASFATNSSCVLLLLYRRLHCIPGSKADSYRVIACILLYTSAMLWRGDIGNYAGVMASYGLGGYLWIRNEKLGHWGHGLFHLMLVPCTYCVVQSASMPQ
ncbi:eef-2 [Symbiodinium natans]|uniref:Eef-2 protein n=1 Tax=Symbiodinium natans TaxID=878477 RepID=A0A812KP75_9DINO|nr:eef-2 [Symbiodinium natans]